MLGASGLARLDEFIPGKPGSGHRQGACAAFVYLVDPFQFFRPSRGVPNFYSVVEFQIPGVARHYPYDAVVTGIKWVAADPKAFEVPASYKALDMSSLNVQQPQSGGAIPPN